MVFVKHSLIVSHTLDHERDLLNLALVQYTSDGNEHQILSRPHGNALGQPRAMCEQCPVQ